MVIVIAGEYDIELGTPSGFIAVKEREVAGGVGISTTRYTARSRSR